MITLIGAVSSPDHTFFLGKPDLAVNQYFVHILSLVFDNQLKGGEWPSKLFHDQSPTVMLKQIELRIPISNSDAETNRTERINLQQ